MLAIHRKFGPFTLGIACHFECFRGSKEVVDLDGSFTLRNLCQRFVCCCCPWLFRQHFGAGRRQVRPARRSDASTMTESRGLYLYRYRQAMQEASLLGGRNAASTATSEPRRLPFLTTDEGLTSSWGTTPSVRPPAATHSHDAADDGAGVGGADGAAGTKDTRAAGSAAASWGHSSDVACGVGEGELEERAVTSLEVSQSQNPNLTPQCSKPKSVNSAS